MVTYRVCYDAVGIEWSGNRVFPNLEYGALMRNKILSALSLTHHCIQGLEPPIMTAIPLLQYCHNSKLITLINSTRNMKNNTLHFVLYL